MTADNLGIPSQSTESVKPLLRTGRTYGLTESPQDLGDSLTIRNARGTSGNDVGSANGGTA